MPLCGLGRRWYSCPMYEYPGRVRARCGRGRLHVVALLAGAALVLPTVGAAQLEPSLDLPGDARLLEVRTLLAPTTSHTVEPTTSTAGQIISIVAGAGVALGMELVGNRFGPAPCAPCDPASVFAFDRGTIRSVQRPWALATDVAVLGSIGGTWADLGRRGNGGDLHWRASIESLAWTMAVTQVLKVSFRRLRPFMYADDAGKYRENADAQQSFPSGHTSAAFAVATAYFLSVQSLTGQDPYWIFGVASFVGVGRVLAGKHWITDVLAGAAIGTATALVVHEARFD